MWAAGGPQRGLQTGEGGASGNSALSPSRRPQTLCTKATMQTVRAADTNEVVKLVFRESDNDRRVSTPGAGHGAPGRGPGQGAGRAGHAPHVSSRCLPRPAPTALSPAGHAAAGEEALRLLRPGGVPRWQRRGEFRPPPSLPGVELPLALGPSLPRLPHQAAPRPRVPVPCPSVRPQPRAQPRTCHLPTLPIGRG